MKLCAVGFLFILILQNSVARADRVDELTRRIEELEKQQAELLFQVSEPRPQVSSFIDNQLTFGGFFEPGYTIIGGEDTGNQAASANILALNFSADYRSKFKFSAQTLSFIGVGLQNQHNDPRAETENFPGSREYNQLFLLTSLVQGIIEYRMDRAFNVQMGLGYAPFGYAFSERELILFQRRGGPQMLRLGTSLISTLWDGVHVHGSIPVGNNTWGYNVYTFSPPVILNEVGWGGRVWWASPDENVVAGISSQIGKGTDETNEVIGADLLLQRHPWGVRTEFFQSISEESDSWSFYVEPHVFVMKEELLLYVFADFLKNADNETNNGLAQFEDPYMRWEYGGGVNWLPTSYTRFRLGLTYNDYIGNGSRIEGQERDFWSVDISAGVAF